MSPSCLLPSATMSNKSRMVSFLLFITIIYMIIVQQTVDCLPTEMKKSKLLFDMDDMDGLFGGLGAALGRPAGDAGDLQRNSARLHRTLFLLDTSDLLKKARLLLSGASSGQIGEQNLINDHKQHLAERSSRSTATNDEIFIRRLRREAKPPTAEPAKYINIIKVRKPFLSIDEETFRPGMSQINRRR